MLCAEGARTAPVGQAVIARALEKSYNGVRAIDGIDFEVRTGECFGILGPNGAGKSTALKMICGLAAVDGGQLQVAGFDVARHPREAKARIGVVPQDSNLDRELSVREILITQSDYHGLRGRRAGIRVEELLHFARLADRRNARPDQLSGGMQRKLVIASALVADPALVILDEPTTGLDPQARHSVWASLEALRRRGVTLIVTTHYMEEAMRVCDRLVIMHRGRIIEEGAPRELVARHRQPDLEAVFMQLTGKGLDA